MRKKKLLQQTIPKLIESAYLYIYVQYLIVIRSLKEILHWHAAVALNNRKWKENNHENENKNSRVQPLNTYTNN